MRAVGSQTIEIPAVVGGREIRTGNTHDVVSPHCHRRVLARVHQADGAAIAAAVWAWRTPPGAPNVKFELSVDELQGTIKVVRLRRKGR